jgi:hypothetical protein
VFSKKKKNADRFCYSVVSQRREAYVEREEAKKLRQKARERTQPKMGKMDINYQVGFMSPTETCLFDVMVFFFFSCVGVARRLFQTSTKTNKFDENWRSVLRRS